MGLEIGAESWEQFWVEITHKGIGIRGQSNANIDTFKFVRFQGRQRELTWSRNLSLDVRQSLPKGILALIMRENEGNIRTPREGEYPTK